MVRVALVTSSYLPHVGGVEEHVRRVARALSADGADVVVWAVDRGDAGTPSEVDGVPVRYLPTPMPARSGGALARFVVAGPRAARTWWRAVRRDRPDVVHVHCYGPNGPWATLAAAVSGRPLVVSSHGETFGDADGVFDRSALLRRSLTASLRRAAAVTGCSRYVLTDLARFGLDAGAGQVVPNGVDLDEPVGEPPPGLPGRYLLALGRVVPTKGFDLLVEAFARAGVEEDLHLVVAGDGPQLADLGALAAERGVGSRVHFPGRLAREQVGAAVRGAQALVVPSRAEAFGIVVLEGWRAGVPVVATTRGGPPEFVDDGETGLLVDPEDVDALAAAISRVAGDAAFAHRVGAAGRRAVEAYTWRAVVDRYRALYARAGLDVGREVGTRG